jgi:hypothetical protein
VKEAIMHPEPKSHPRASSVLSPILIPILTPILISLLDLAPRSVQASLLQPARPAGAAEAKTSTGAVPAATSTRTEAGGSLSDALDRAMEGSVASSGAPVAAERASGAGGGLLLGAQRAFQSLNPDIAAILDVTGGFSERAPRTLAGDDPDLKGGLSDHSAGFTVQEVEVAVQSIVDPYLRADLFLTIPNLSGLEIEEGFVTTTALPLDLQLKAGIFRSAFGRQNGQHLHVQDFTRRPLINTAYLGTDGLRPPGAQLSWLAPLPFFLQLNLEAFSVAPPDDLSQLSSFGGGRRRDLTYAVEIEAFGAASESFSVLAGLNAAFGRTPGMAPPMESAIAAPAYENARTQLLGADLYVKYKPPNVAEGYFNLAFTAEYFYRRVRDAAETVADGGIYGQLVAQLARRWSVGVREDILGIPASVIQPRVTRTSGSLTFTPSEFARVRAYVEREFTDGQGLSPADSFAAYLQIEAAIGAHGAHAF